LPTFDIPVFSTQTDRNLVRWTSLLYWITWECDEVYLQAELEYEESLDHVGFFPWIECPKPPLCDPRQWMLLQKGYDERLETADNDFRRASLKWPDLINGYLIEDLFFSSTTAIDLLVHQLPASLAENTLQQSTGGKSTDTKRKQARRRTVKEDIRLLRALLIAHHLESPTGERVEPLSQEEIGFDLGWSQPKVSRRMSEMFPEGGMKHYRRCFIDGLPVAGFKRLLRDGQQDIEAIDESDDADD